MKFFIAFTFITSSLLAQTNIEDLVLTATKKEKTLKLIRSLTREDLKQKLQNTVTITSKNIDDQLSMGRASDDGVSLELQRFEIDFKARTVKSTALLDGKEFAELMEEDEEEVLEIFRDPKEREAILKGQVIAVNQAVNCQTHRGLQPSATKKENGIQYFICDKKETVYQRTDGMRLTQFSDLIRKYSSGTHSDPSMLKSRNKKKLVLKIWAGVYEWKRKEHKTLLMITSFDSRDLENNLQKQEELRGTQSDWAQHIALIVNQQASLIQILGGQRDGELLHPFEDNLNYSIRTILK